MTKEDKLPYFEHLVKLFVNWHKEVSDSDNNDLSVLKVLKLLFFVTAFDAKSDEENSLLDKVFDNFYAMPYGHVESDIYTLIKERQFNHIKIDNNSSEIIDNKKIVLDKELEDILEKSFKNLKEFYPNLILASSFDLVDLSHSWYSWQYFYAKAKEELTNSKRIENDVIKKEDKIFTI